MSLPGEGLKNWIILPSILSQNQNRVKVPKMHQSVGEYTSKLKLPDVKSKKKMLSSQKYLDKTVKKQHKLCKNSTLKSQQDTREMLEFVSIVNNPPTKLKFLTRTEVRDSQQAKHVCGRWLEHFAKSIRVNMEKGDKEVNSCLGSPDETFFDSRENDPLNEYGNLSDELASLTSIELRLLGNDEIDETYGEKEQSSKKHCGNCDEADILNLISDIDFGPYRRQTHLNTFRERVERSCNECLAKSLMGTYLDNYEYLITRPIELEKRKKRIRYLPDLRANRQNTVSTPLNNYHMSIEMCEAQNLEYNKEKSLATSKIRACERFELKAKSSLDTRRSASHDEILKPSTLQMYPFYETHWREEGTGAVSRFCHMPISEEEIHPNVQLFASDNVQCITIEQNVDLDVNKALRISQIKLKNKGVEIQSIAQEQSAVRMATTGKTNSLQLNNTQKSPNQTASEDSQKSDENILESAITEESQEGSSTDSVECLPVDQALLGTESHLLRLVINTDKLTDSEIIRLIENGEIDLKKFLIIKQILPLYEKDWGNKGGKRTNQNDSRVKKLIDFLDRLDKLSYLFLDSRRRTVYENIKTQKITSDFVVLGLSSGRLEKVEEKERVKIGKRRIKCLRSKRLMRHQENVENSVDSSKVQPQKISLQRSMFVSAVSLKENKRLNSSNSYDSKTLPQLARNANFRRGLMMKKANSCHRNFPSKKLEDEDIVLLGNPPSSRNSLVSSFDSMSSVLASHYVPMSTNRSPGWNLNMENQFGSKLVAQETERKESYEAKNVSDLLKNKVNIGLKNNFQLYPRMKNLLNMVNERENIQADIKAVRDTKIDYLAHFKLVNERRIEMYCKAFAKVDHSGNGEILFENIDRAVRFVDSLMSVPKKYIEYTLQILDLGLLSRLTIKIFCVLCTILERMVDGGDLIEDAMKSMCLMANQGKMIWYKEMFYDAVDFDRNYINLETVKLELFAGGMNGKEERDVTNKITTDDQRISLVDFVAYIPLFISIHDKICSNAFNMKV